ncbi:DoxX family protein [Umboniibacter marinipuniceus]|uniref:Putative membrane protein YphA (DoxX/SURF4 family) n=1 Tax=Umboniibacter marinipuniceus TaxID=569599 RepID=A0A3M0A5R7_9GAMM|nr:DoxX family protein [Umboniibacter marinipuniceus]RMA79956.1 putative membrane protein YphA (DoxX/SURF4 family) [Umboniibacter marinipuniceus]
MKLITTLKQTISPRLASASFLANLALRLFLAPIFIMAGSKKLANIDNTIAWFANDDWGLGLPFPELLGWSVALLEFVGGFLILFGLATRLIALLLFFTMIVAAFTAHWANGWQMIADPSWFGVNERVAESAAKLSKAKEILQQHGNYRWLSSSGSIVILNNGIETAINYAVMLLALAKLGGGRWISIDFWIKRRVGNKVDAS